MKDEKRSNSPRTWRDIPQHVETRRMSPLGRRRVWVAAAKTVGVVVGAGVLICGAIMLIATWQESSQKITAPVHSEPLAAIKLSTDGVVPDRWVGNTLGLEPGVGLMEIDLELLQTRLLASGQVKHAVVGREFPDTLKIALIERTPVARVRTLDDTGAPIDYMVDAEGYIYMGVGYDRAVVRGLPFVGGVALRPSAKGFQPIAGMELVSELLSTAEKNTPNLYRHWQVVDIGRLATDGEMVVRSRQVEEITFGAQLPFYSQLARLDMIVAESAVRAGQPLHSVNLAVDRGLVPVAMQPRSERRIDLLGDARPTTQRKRL